MTSQSSKESLRRVVLDSPVGPAARAVREALRPAWERRNRADDNALSALIRLGLPRNANVVDVGANLGLILAAAVVGCPGGRHVAFEPVPHLADVLERRFPHVQVRREALSDHDGTADFTVVLDRESRSGLSSSVDLADRFRQRRSIPVQVARLDALRESLPPPHLVKIDVEGAELAVLRGARETLAVHRPLVAFEHQRGRRPDHATRETATAVYRIFSDLRYGVSDLDGEELDESAFIAAVLTAQRWNFLARP